VRLSWSSGRRDATPAHLRDRLRLLDCLPDGSPPAPWASVSTPHIGGLTEVGFADSSDDLLAVSVDGRGLFDCLTGRLIARDRATDYAAHAGNLTVAGVGPRSGEQVRVAGLWGGGLAETSADGWSLRRRPDTGFDDEVVLIPRGRDLFDEGGDVDGFSVFRGFVTEVRAFGFSPTGRSFVIATASEIQVFARD